jgi:ferredoxin
MRITIDDQLCIACGLCEELLPEVFIMQNQKARVKQASPTDEQIPALEAVIEDCPAEAISLSETSDV